MDQTNKQTTQRAIEPERIEIEWNSSFGSVAVEHILSASYISKSAYDAGMLQFDSRLM